MILDTSGTTLKLTMGAFMDLRLRYFGDTNKAFHLGGRCRNSCGHDSRHVCSSISYIQLSIFFILVQIRIVIYANNFIFYKKK